MVKERKTELVEGFRHSVPYINTHRGKTFVIMLGGEAIEHENFSSIVNDIGLLHSLGIRLVVVYGARPQIDRKSGCASPRTAVSQEYTCDRRQNTGTGEAGCGNIATGYYCSPVDEFSITRRYRARISTSLAGNFIIAQPLGVDDGVDYCHSGRIRRIDEDAIHRQLDSGAMVLMGAGRCFSHWREL